MKRISTTYVENDYKVVSIQQKQNRTMGRNKSCDPDTRQTIVLMRRSGMSYDKIANDLKVSKNMAYNAVKYFEQHGTFDNVERKKRPRKTTPKMDELIVQAVLADPEKSSNDIQRELFGGEKSEISISSSTIRRRLREIRSNESLVIKKKPKGSKNKKKKEK